MINKIHSKYLYQELFSFISENKKLKLIQNNSYIIKKLDLSIYDYKIFLFQKKIKKYDYFNINDYYDEFSKDLNSIIENKEELDNLFYNCLSKSDNFDLNIFDEKFDLMINNPYFKKKIRISMEGINNIFQDNIPKLLLIKNNQLTDKAIKVFKDIFKIFSTNGRMNKIQGIGFINSMLDIENNIIDQYINNLFSLYDIDNDELLSFEDLQNFYLDSIKNDNDNVWKYLYSLGYNNLLENTKEIDYNYILNHPEEFEKSSYLNLIKISKEKIYKLSLFMNIDKTILQCLNNQQIFFNLKVINISIYNLNQMINLNIICPNIEELNLKVIEMFSEYNINELNNIFPNMNDLNIIIKTKFDLFDLLKNLRNSQIENLRMNIFDFDDNYKIDSKIILNKIKNLEIIGYNFNNFLFHFFNNFELPNLRKYILNIELNIITNLFLLPNNNDYNIINQFIINTLNNKDKFSLISFFSLPNQLKFIRHLQIDFHIFCFVYKRKRGKNYLFKFNINNNKFKQYYSNFDLSIDKNEINKYKKIDIKGISYKNEINIEKIIEKEDINLSDIYFNLNQNQYFINSFKKLRSIYCENKVDNILIVNQFLNQKENFNYLKHINLNIDYISNNSNNIYYILSEFIKRSRNLKSLILRLSPYNFNENIIYLLQLIENSKKLKKINITQNINNPKYDLNLKKILKKFPKLQKRLYIFDEFIIGNEILIPKQKSSFIIYEVNNNILGKTINLLNINNNEIKQKCILYLNNKKINNFKYKFSKERRYKFKIIFKEPLINIGTMFPYNFSSLILFNFNINNAIDISGMFSNCSFLTSLNLSNFNSINVNNMSWMFAECISLTYLNLSNFKTDNVNNMSYMFFNCKSLEYLNLYEFNTKNVTNMSYMFSNCSCLKYLNLCTFNTCKLINSTYMFYNCSSLTFLNLLIFNSINVTNMSFMFLGLNKNCRIILNDEKMLNEL